MNALKFRRVRLHILDAAVSWIGVVAFALGIFSPVAATANILSWSGGGSTGNWNDIGNWSFIATPTNGDTLIFPASQPRLNNTNNITNLVLNQIRFVGTGGGYSIFGNPVTMTNSIEATNSSVPNTINFAITNTLGASTTNFIIDVGAGMILTLTGVLSGTADITKIGLGTLVYQTSGNNFYTGTTRVNAGTLALNVGGTNAFAGPLIVGDGVSNTNQPVARHLRSNQIPDAVPITINKTGLLDLNNFFDVVGTNITLHGDTTISTASGALTLGDNAVITSTGGFSTISGSLVVGATACTISNDFVLTINAIISGAGTITKLGDGDLHFNGPNYYTGLTQVQQGLLFVGNATGLGATNNGTVVANGGSLSLDGAITVTNEPLSLTGPGSENDFGTLDGNVGPGTATWLGPVTVNGSVVFSSAFTNGTLRISGPISGPGSITVGADFNGGSVMLAGGSANTYAGATTIETNLTLLLDKSSGNAIPGNIEVAGTLRLLGSEQIANTADVLVDGTGLFDFTTFYDSFDTLRGTGQVTFGTGGFLEIGLNNGSSEFDGLMSGTGFVGGYTVGKFGTGKFTMTANNTYQNLTHIYGGTCIINGSQTQSSVIIEAGTTIGGSGFIGGITGSGFVSPGNPVGTLFCASNVVFNSSVTNLFDITGPTSGLYDALSGSRTNFINGAILNINQAITTPLKIGDQLPIVTANSIQGSYNGLPNGTIFSIGGYSYVINYSSTQVTLTVTNIPGAFAGSSVSSGNGNHVIDPNECNNLFLVVSNKTASPMTGVSAFLTTSTPHVFVTQPLSPYPDIPASGKMTNLASFQLTTTSNFNCGDPVNLALSVFSSQGAFTIPVTLSSGGPGTPIVYTNSTTTAIPDVGSVDSTNVVSGFSGPLEKVTVALYITHSFDGDLTNISLIGPDNTTVLLSAANGGGGVNYGSSCADGSRTSFDDAATTSITAGVAPFVGTFVPQQPLSAFIGKTGAAANGNWRLHIADGFGGSLGTLRCWTLSLSPVACPAGAGICAGCFGVITNTIGAGDPVSSVRVSRAGVASSCAALPKTCPGTIVDTNHFDMYNFTNNGPATCVTVYLDNLCGTLFSAAYLGSYSTNSLCNNYLGDIANNVISDTYSFSVPAQTNFIIVVNEVPVVGPGCDYTLLVSETDCQPQLNIVRDPSATNQVHLSWSSAGGGYNLEATPSLSFTNWAFVTNEPVVNGGTYNVTNVIGTNKFYRLHKP